MAEFDDATVHIADAAWTQASVGKPQSYVSGAEGDNLPIKFWSDLDSVVPPDRLVRHLLGINSLVLVYGEPGSGKTFLVADLGMHIALGREWFGRDVTAGAVLYVACEGVAGLSNRLAAYRQRHHLAADVPFAVVPVAVDLGPDGQDAPRVTRAAETVKARYGLDVQLIIVDTLARDGKW
jgi:RecA-family ATPase